MYCFVLVYHIKSQLRTFIFVVKTWQNLEKLKGGEYFCKPLYVRTCCFHLRHLRPCPHVPKQYSPPCSLASFQEYLRPNGSTENDSKCSSSYSRPIGGTWNSPKKRRSMRMKLVYKQTVDRVSVHNKKKTKIASARNQSSLCGPIMRSTAAATHIQLQCK